MQYFECVQDKPRSSTFVARGLLLLIRPTLYVTTATAAAAAALVLLRVYGGRRCTERRHCRQDIDVSVASFASSAAAAGESRRRTRTDE